MVTWAVSILYVVWSDLLGPVLRLRGQVVVGVVCLSDPTEQHGYDTYSTNRKLDTLLKYYERQEIMFVCSLRYSLHLAYTNKY